ncbi:MAG: AAA family ATPase [Desulfovibrionaceae bacterium]|nr:AAA family ATPase [Desulfovibrionaceae bacterium]
MAIIQNINELKERINIVSKWDHRDLYNNVIDYLKSSDAMHVYVLRGLRRTGKTTIALQALISEEAKKLGKAAIMQVEDGDRISLLKKDIKELYNNGVRVLLIDEATKAVDFTNGSAVLPDIFSGMGMKIILTGTDSLKFYFANGNGLFDRVYEGRTTYIPFKEWKKIIKLGDLDTYIEYGGTLCHEYTEKDKVDCFSFANSTKTYEYIDSAIAQNIQYSLETESGRRSFHDLFKLYYDGLLTGIINRIVERENHYIILETVQRKFFPKDLEDGINNIAKDTWRNIPYETFNKINIEKLINNLMKSLAITNDKTLHEVTDEQMQRLKKYLYDLDLFVPDKTYVISPQYNSDPICIEDKDCNICVQPGLRYNHAKTLINTLTNDTFIQSGKLTQQ